MGKVEEGGSRCFRRLLDGALLKVTPSQKKNKNKKKTQFLGLPLR
jgi:hypothetical protein